MVERILVVPKQPLVRRKVDRRIDVRVEAGSLVLPAVVGNLNQYCPCRLAKPINRGAMEASEQYGAAVV